MAAAVVGIKKTCINPKNLFCFVCGEYIRSHHKRSIMTKPLIDAYEAYFEVRTLKHNYAHGPPSVCNECNQSLLRWHSGQASSAGLLFEVPMVWSEPSNHETDCYFCLTRTAVPSLQQTKVGYIGETVYYPQNLPSAIKPRSRRCVDVSPTVSLISSRISTGTSTRTRLSLPMMATQAIPVQANNTSGRLSTTTRQLTAVVAGEKRKSTGPASDNTNGLTKVRIRRWEPTAAKPLPEAQKPATPVASPHTPPRAVRTGMRTRAVTAEDAKEPNGNPRILSVYSLQDYFSSYDDFSSKETMLTSALNGENESTPITIEIEDDDDEQEDEKEEKEQKPPAVKEEVKQEERPELPKPEPTVKTELKFVPVTIKKEPSSELAVTKANEKLTPAASAPSYGFININSLACSSSTAAAFAGKAGCSSSSPSAKTVVIQMDPSRKRVPTAATVITPAKTLPTITSVSVAPKAAAAAAASAPPVVKPPHLITQSELILLIRDLDLPREKSAVLIDRLKRWNLLAAQLMCRTNPAAVAEAASAAAAAAVVVPSPANLVPVVHRVTTASALSQLRGGNSITVKGGGAGKLPTVISTATGHSPPPAQRPLAPKPTIVKFLRMSDNKQPVLQQNGVTVRRLSEAPQATKKVPPQIQVEMLSSR